MYSIFHFFDKFPGVGFLECGYDFFLCEFRVGYFEIIFDGHCEEHWFLSYESYFSPVVEDVDGSDVDSIDGDVAFAAIIVAHE